MVQQLLHSYKSGVWFGSKIGWALIAGPVAQWITRLTTDQKIPGSNPGRFGAFAIMCTFTVCIAGMQSNKMNACTSCISFNDVLIIECVGVWGLHFHI